MAGDLCAKALIRQGCAAETALRVSGMADQEQIPGGVVHELPSDFGARLKREPQALATWLDITPLARNEWICWIESAKKPETRQKRIAWGSENLTEGKRRPCCWPGCPHREKTGK
jgi:uncharacterized protein YdeI (YjbR/CyaY-like superfamily)